MLQYHEAWFDGEVVNEHWGVVGDRGQLREHEVPAGTDPEAVVSRLLATAEARAFQPIDDEDFVFLIIEHAIEGFGTASDLEFRFALQTRMDETLGWTGLGYCDGGSTGSGTFEVCCVVLDFEIAKSVIEKDLENTEFHGYSRIYNQTQE